MRKYNLILLFVVGLSSPLLSGLQLGHSLWAQEAEPSFLEQLKEKIWSSDETDTQQVVDTDTEQLSIGDKYGPFLDLIHGDELLYYDSLLESGTSIDWNEYQHLVDVKFERSDTTLAPNIKVFGWHPYWMGSAYEQYDFGLLSHVAWFAYHIDPLTGSYSNEEVIEGWRSKALQDVAMAQNPNTKVLLTVANHTTSGNRQFLNNDFLQQETLIDTLLLLLQQGAGHGIDINFELMPRNYEKAMTDFLRKLSEALKGANPEYLLTVVLPKVNSPRIYDIERLQEYVDYFLITGYDYHTGQSRRDGPIAPLRSSHSRYSIENTVYSYLEDGLDREKLILGLPYYGAIWNSAYPELRSQDSTLQFERHITYRAIQAKYCINGSPDYDWESCSAYFVLPNEDTTRYQKIWFDDSLTLNRKYDWVLQQELAGIGIWALGYDNGDQRLWNLIRDKYAADTLVTYQGAYLDSKVFNLAESLIDYQHVVGIASIFLLLFLVIGLLGSLYDWRVREVFFANRTVRIIYIVAGFTIVLALVAFITFTGEIPFLGQGGVLGLGIGLILGVLLVLVISKSFRKRRSELP